LITTDLCILFSKRQLYISERARKKPIILGRKHDEKGKHQNYKKRKNVWKIPYSERTEKRRYMCH
jgi:hypothetical protein